MSDADALVEQTRELGHGALLARSLRARAELERRLGRRDDAIADLREGWSLALGAGDELTAAACIVGLVGDLGGAAEFEEAAFRTDEARAMVARVRRHDPVQAETLEALLDEALGRIALRQHRYEDAVAFYERAIAVTERQSGSDSLRTSQAVNALAAAKLAEKRWDEAVGLFRRVLEIRIKHLGHSHPETAQGHNSLGLALKNAGRLEEADEELEHAHALLVEALGPDERSVRMIEMNLAELYYAQDRHAESAEVWDRVLGLEGAAAVDDEFGLRRAMHYATSLVYAGRVAEGRTVLEVCRHAPVVLTPAMREGITYEFERLDGFILGGELGL